MRHSISISPPRKIAAAALTFAALLLSPLASAAQTSTVGMAGDVITVGNLTAGGSATTLVGGSSHLSHAKVVRFTTGGAAGDRFVLREIALPLHRTGGDQITATLRADSGGAPNGGLYARGLAAFTPVVPVTGAQRNYIFTPDDAVTLAGNTAYHIVLVGPPSGSASHIWQTTHSSVDGTFDEDAGSAPGWDINSAFRSRSGNWQPVIYAPRIWMRLCVTRCISAEERAALARIAAAEAHALVTVQMADAVQTNLTFTTNQLTAATLTLSDARRQLADAQTVRDGLRAMVSDDATMMLPARLMELVDLTGDRAFGQSDFLLHYYAGEMADLLGDGTEDSGSAVWRRVLLAPLAGGTAATDTALRMLLERANELRAAPARAAPARAAPSP